MLRLKSFVRIRENENFVVKANFVKNEIRFEYYYNDVDKFFSEKEINYLNKFLKVAKFNQKKCLKPVVFVYVGVIETKFLKSLKKLKIIGKFN